MIMASQKPAPEHANGNATDNWAAQLRKGSLELAILASFWREPLYGLEVLRCLTRDAGLSVAEGTLYPILNRLRVDGLLDSEWREAGTGHPRKYYKLTDAGRRRTLAMAESWTEFSRQMDGVLALITAKGAAKHD